MTRQQALSAFFVLLSAAGCRPSVAASAPPPETAEACAARLTAFTDAVAKMPDQTVASANRADLPASTLGALPGPGPVLDVSEAAASLDGVALPGATPSERALRLKDPSTAPSGSAAGAASGAPRARPAFYIATSADTDVQTLREYIAAISTSFELRLLVRIPKPAGSAPSAAPDDPATRVLLESDPEARRRIAEQGYAQYADCPAVGSAIASVSRTSSRERWPALKSALHAALPGCACSKVDTVHLQSLVGAEQQAGAGAVGYVPISFLRDERCGASMPLRSMRKLMQQIEQFDAEFSGNWQKDALAFGDVVKDDRLKVYFCSALPGETLAARERARATLYLKPPGTSSCEPWRFEPLSPGAPMGTWRRAAGGGRPALAFHYWQAAEELRVYGPVDPEAPTKPTDDKDWACEVTHRLTGVDDDSLQVEGGRWFFDDATCRKSSDSTDKVYPCTKAAAELVSPTPAPAAQ
jgi:hypothetical protein